MNVESPETDPGEIAISLLTNATIENDKIEKISEIANDRESSTESSIAAKSEISNPTDNDFINLDEIELSDEDTWLYTPQKELTSEEKGLSPYKWLRKDVEDPNNKELQLAKTALVSKLNELERSSTVADSSMPDDENISVGAAEEPVKEDATNSPKCCVHSPLKDVADIIEKARLQEESLKQSSSKFFNEAARTFPRGTRVTLPNCALSPRISKPASVETLHAYQANNVPVVGPVFGNALRKFMSSSPNQCSFESTTSLSYTNDVHRGSLPNLNKGYNSLKPKKCKRGSEPRIQCPLPICPPYSKPGVHGAIEEASQVQPKCMPLQLPTKTYRESQTLPSSYRMKSRNSISSSRDHLSVLSNPRRESEPFPMSQKNGIPMQLNRRESSPCVKQIPLSYGQQVGPKKMHKPLNQYTGQLGYSPNLRHSRTASLNQLSSDGAKDFQRLPSHSPMKRMPLSSVHNCSPKQDDSLVIRSTGDMRKSSLPSRIPSPALRSGIPVPSAQCVIRSSPNDDTWSKDFY